MKGRKNLVWMLLVILLFSMTITFVRTSSSDPVMYVDPQTTTKSPGENFDVNIMVSGAVNLWMCTFQLIFDHNILEVVDVNTGDTPPYMEKIYVETLNATWGWVKAVVGRELGVKTGLTGTVQLAKITFKVKAAGECFLHLHETATTIVDAKNIEHVTRDGYFGGPYPPPEIHVITETFWSRNVTVMSSSTISNFNFSREDKEISFDVEGTSGTIGFCDVMFWNDLISGNFTVLLDGKSLNLSSWRNFYMRFNLDYRTTVNETHIGFYLAYYHQSPRKIQILGTEVIPEIPEPIHDIAITKVTRSPTTVPEGDPVSINVTVVNLGTFSEDFNVTAYYDDNQAAPTQNVTGLAAKASKLLKFTWDTTGVSLDTYTIKAVASNVTGENKTADNTKVDGTVKVEEAPPPFGAPVILYAFAGALIAIIAIAAVFWAWRRRKPKPT